MNEDQHKEFIATLAEAFDKELLSSAYCIGIEAHKLRPNQVSIVYHLPEADQRQQTKVVNGKEEAFSSSDVRAKHSMAMTELLSLLEKYTAVSLDAKNILCVHVSWHYQDQPKISITFEIPNSARLRQAQR